MSQITKSVLTAGGIVAAAAAVILGSSRRDQIDLGDAAPSLDGLMASRERQVNVPATDFYRDLTQRVKREYVEPVDDDMKLATGAVRGMVGSLADPKSLFMDKEEFRVFLEMRQGKYEGIGADIVLRMPSAGSKASRELLQPAPSEDAPAQGDMAVNSETPKAPRLMVASIVPGGPADKAGVKIGDLVESVDDHWVYNNDVLLQFRKAQRDYQAKRITLTQINALRKKLRAKYDKVMLPLRAKDKLIIGNAGIVKVVWERAGALRTTEIPRSESARPDFGVEGDVVRLPFRATSADALRQAINGKKALTIDLRNNVLGDFDSMRKCLAVVAPSGTYGSMVSQRKAGDVPLKVTTGNPTPPKLTLLVDSSTRGPAEIFALALSSKGIAKLSGSQTGNDRTIYDVVQLPDGTGYTLATSEFRAVPALKGAAK